MEGVTGFIAGAEAKKKKKKKKKRGGGGRQHRTVEGRRGGDTRAGYETRYALHQVQAPSWPQQRIALAGEMLLEYMLFRNEATLPGPVRGTSGFSTEFPAIGPRDSQGRSLRQFDLQSRLFRYPCSYMIYSAAFDSLPAEMKRYLWERLDQILSGRDHSAAYATMDLQDRQNLLAILRDTKLEFAEWMRNHGETAMK